MMWLLIIAIYAADGLPLVAHVMPNRADCETAARQQTEVVWARCVMVAPR